MIRTVWNLGLPRTGTTSVSAALADLGFQCTAIGAQWTAEAWAGKPAPFIGRDMGPAAQDALLICSSRDADEWVASCRRWRPTVPDSVFLASLEAHQRWLLTQMRERTIGLFTVTKGFSALLRALSVAARDDAVRERMDLPHLNRSGG